MKLPAIESGNETIEGTVSSDTGMILKVAFPAILCVIALLISIGYFFQYPEIARARVVVTGISDSGNLIGINLDFPPNNLVIVKVGQKIQLFFDLYPNNKFGFVTGVLQYIDTSSNNNIKARIRLFNKLSTSQNIDIPYKTGLKADAIITIKNMRLMQRLFRNYRK